MPDDPKPDPDSSERRFTWHKGDLVVVSKGDGIPLITPEELEAAIKASEPALQARRARAAAEQETATNVDYPDGEDIDYGNERSKP